MSVLIKLAQECLRILRIHNVVLCLHTHVQEQELGDRALWDSGIAKWVEHYGIVG